MSAFYEYNLSSGRHINVLSNILMQWNFTINMQPIYVYIEVFFV